MTPEASQQIKTDGEHDEVRGLMRADLDDAPCCICGETESKARMDWLHNARGEQGWCCKECQVESEKYTCPPNHEDE
jgi:hypothetical protein